MQVSEFGMIRELVRRGLGVALLPTAERHSSDLVEIPLEGPQYRREIALVSPQGGGESAPTRHLREFVLRSFGQADR